MQKNEVILTKPILPLLIKLSLPLSLAGIFQLLYFLVDLYFAGQINTQDPSIVGGIGLVFFILFAAFGIANGFIVGMSSFISRCKGNNKEALVFQGAITFFSLATLISIIIIGLAYIFSDNIITLIGGKGDYFKNAKDYFFWIQPAIFFLLGSSVIAGYFQGRGKMTPVMLAIILGTLLNIILDPVFIFIFNWGVAGAAIATMLSYVISFLYLVIIFLKEFQFKIPVKKFIYFDSLVLKNYLYTGLPQSLTQFAMALGLVVFNLILTKISLNHLTAFTLYSRMETLIYIPVYAISQSMIPIIGQNIINNKLHRAIRTWPISLGVAALAVIILAILMVWLSPQFYPFFTEVKEVLEITRTMTLFLSFGVLAAISAVNFRSIYFAIARPFMPVFISILRLFGIIIPIILIRVFILNQGINGFIIGFIEGNLISSIICYFMVKKTFTQIKKGKYIVLKTEA